MNEKPVFVGEWQPYSDGFYKGWLKNGVPWGFGVAFYGPRNPSGTVSRKPSGTDDLRALNPKSLSSRDFYYTYMGDWLEGRKHGVGKWTDGSGSCYEGEYVQGFKTGKGAWRLSVGHDAVGTFHQGSLSGRGLYRWSADHWYEGEFFNGEFHGLGVLVWKKSGVVVTGQWHEGHRVGCCRTDIRLFGSLWARYGAEDQRKGDALFQWINGDWWHGRYSSNDRAWGVKHLAKGGWIVGEWHFYNLHNGVGTMWWVPPGRTTKDAVSGTVHRGIFSPHALENP